MNRRPNRRRPDSDSESVHRAGLGRGPTNASWRRGGAAGASPAAPVEPAALSSPPASAATSAKDPGARGPRARGRRLIGCGFAPSQSRSDAAAKNSLRGLESAQGGGVQHADVEAYLEHYYDHTGCRPGEGQVAHAVCTRIRSSFY